jgi:hypothetical protein
MVVGFTSSKGRHLSDSVVHSHEVCVLRELGDDLARAHPLSLTCYRGDRHETLFWGCVHPTFDLVKGSVRFRMGRFSQRCLRRSFHFLLSSSWAFLSSLVSSMGALADNLSAEISSKYRSGWVPEGPSVSPAAMKTWRLGVPRSESVVTTSVGVCSSTGASGVASWKGSESR